MRKGPVGRRSDRHALGFLGACVAALYVAVAASALAPHAPGKAARGELGSGLSASVPALRYSLMEQDGVARSLRPTVMSKLFFGGAPEAPAGADVPPAAMAGRHVPETSVAVVSALYADLGYRLEPLRAGVAEVPRLYLAAVPDDLKAVRDVEDRKSLFLRTVLPLVLRVNEEIAADRARLMALDSRIKSGRTVPRAEVQWLTDLADYYKLETADIGALLKRVDAVPVALALAQAAEESGWGTSRFAREGNALFGQWTTNPSVRGLVPRDRAADAVHRVRAFPTLLDAVRAYARNLNTHRSYAAFREERRRLRQAGADLDGYRLAGTLLAYSERGPAYVQTLRVIMRANALPELERVRLGSQVAQAG